MCRFEWSSLRPMKTDRRFLRHLPEYWRSPRWRSVPIKMDLWWGQYDIWAWKFLVEGDEDFIAPSGSCCVFDYPPKLCSTCMVTFHIFLTIGSIRLFISFDKRAQWCGHIYIYTAASTWVILETSVPILRQIFNTLSPISDSIVCAKYFSIFTKNSISY